MASLIESALRLAFKRAPKEGTLDEEHAAHVGSTTLSSALGGGSSQFPGQGATGNLISDDDRLTLFRLMLGITAAPSLGFSQSGPAGTRPAANIGLYTRIVHAEMKAKDSFKVFSVVINACYILQIVVAASLTAMGAGNVDNKAITAFGAINTIIAGFLTFLKGSGLPARLKYFGNEWKKIREFIEQRERDFSRAGCTLDVHDVVATIERMYAVTKNEIEMNTPDSYNSVTNTRAMFGGGEGGGGLDMARIEGIFGKLKSLDGTLRNLKAGIDEKVHDVQDATYHVHDDEKHAEEEIRRLGNVAMAEIEKEKLRLTREVSQRLEGAARGGRDQLRERGEHAGTEARDMHNRAWDEARGEVARQMRTTASGLDKEKS